MKVLAILAAGAVAASGAFAQVAVSAKAGMIHHVEGDVTAGGAAVSIGKNQFPSLKEGETLETADGRAEILLSSGAFLRLAENSSVKMLNASLTDTRIELSGEAAMVEVVEIVDGAQLTIEAGASQVTPKKAGIYRFGGSPMELRVYEGQAEVRSGGRTVTAKRSAIVALETGQVAGKFDAKTGDAFQRWSARRSGYIATANVSAAKMIYDDPMRFGYGMGFRGGWMWNPWFGMFTYIPYSGVLASPFGFFYYTPRQVFLAYAPPPRPVFNEPGFSRVPVYNPNLGYSTVGARSAPGSESANVGASAAPAPAPASGRGGENGAVRGPANAGGRVQ